MSNVKLLLNTVKLAADGGRVECSVAAPDGSVVQGVIEKAFFEDFMGVPDPKLSLAQRSRIVQDNIDYFEREAARQWSMGKRDLVIS
ncbi:MAG: hypothetical protein DI628_07520 [Blastochloris viridis]|uniref:Uncharacterized protein n=1 Tax=Blastochloris viridis TaxID=1079 RepID=A0A6N4R9B6_BLAVI|nr:MAG: hypothetical protein DI628_07520 [Blastochloris viridis]